MILRARGRTIVFPRRALVMGIVNINDDSFCRDGTLDHVAAISHAESMVQHGADIVDVGAESARTNRPPISEGEECARLLPFIHLWNKWTATLADSPPFVPSQVWPPLLSLNTWRPSVVAQILPHGGEILNDIGALPIDVNARLCADHGAALVIMHSIGSPKEKHTHDAYSNIMTTLHEFFGSKIGLVKNAGLGLDSIILDPGIDFAKQAADNLRIYHSAESLLHFNCPILFPISRKTVIGQTLHLPDPTSRDAGTIACLVSGALRGAHIFRVHNVPAAMDALRVMDALISA